jgi:hypothetical protein
VPECKCRSVAEIVKLKVPDWLGVPEMTPVVLERTRPVGSCPEETVKWYGAVPPLAVKVAL